MSIVWIIEKPKKNQGSLAGMLQGDFPVRLFGSMESFVTLQRMKRSAVPDALVIALDDWGLDYASCHKLLDNHLPTVKKVFCTSLHGDTKSNGNSLILKLNQNDPLHITRELQDLLDGKGRGRHISFKNIQLDMETFTLAIPPDDEAIPLPGKEARLLKMLMEKSGQCVKRETLQEAVWGDTIVSPRTIDSHISRLRKRLNYAGIDIENIYGDGYRLV